jgi:hypothetical protein
MRDKPLLVLPPRYTEDSIALGGAAVRAGWDVERLMGWRVADWMAGRDAAVYGEPLFVAAVAEALGILALEPPAAWLTTLPAEFRLRKIEMMSLGEVREWPGRAFIKPAVDKGLAARVYESGAELPEVGVWPESTLVMISEVVEWEVEWRCFVLEREVVTASAYWRRGRLARSAEGEWEWDDAEEGEALAFARRVLGDSRVRLPPAVVVDVGRLADGRWAVIEANSAWGSGIYGCDPGRVLGVVRRGCVRAATAADREWVVERGYGG